MQNQGLLIIYPAPFYFPFLLPVFHPATSLILSTGFWHSGINVNYSFSVNLLPYKSKSGLFTSFFKN